MRQIAISFGTREYLFLAMSEFIVCSIFLRVQLKSGNRGRLPLFSCTLNGSFVVVLVRGSPCAVRLFCFDSLSAKMDSWCQKSWNLEPKNQKWWLLNLLSNLVCWFLFALIDRFKLIWSFIVKCAMRPLSIVKFYVVIDAFFELLFRFVLCTINLFSLHEREKRLHNGVVMRLTWGGKGLDNLVHA